MASKYSTKQAATWGDLAPWAGGGALAAVPAFALVKLVNEIRNEREARALQQKPTDTDENTIVLTLPKASGPKVASLVKSSQLDPLSESTAFALKPVAAAGSAITTYALLDALYKHHVKKELQAEEEKAKQEMLTAMMPNKQAGGGDSIWSQSGTNVSGALKLLMLLGTGGTAYLTKKILDERYDAGQLGSAPLPKVKRIVFKGQTAQPDVTTKEELKEANVNDTELLKLAADVKFLQASTYIMMDLMRGGPMYVLTDPGVKQACAGIDLDKLCKLAREVKSADELLEKLADDVHGPVYNQVMQTAQDPNTVNSFIDAQTKNAPSWVGGAGKWIYRQAPEFFNKQFVRPMAEKQYAQRGLSGLDNLLSGFGEFGDKIVNGIRQYGRPILSGLADMYSRYKPRAMYYAQHNPFANVSMASADEKQAGTYNARILGTLANAVIVSRAMQAAQESQDEHTRLSQEAQPLSKEQLRNKMRTVQIAATDPTAHEYVKAHRAKLMAALQQLAEEDKI